MGLKCNIKAEVCGSHCTSYDGTTDRTIVIKKGSNLWEAGRKDVAPGVWCPDCRDSFKSKWSGMQDITNLSTGERKKPYDARNLKKVVDLYNCVYSKCKSRGDCI